MTHAASAMNKKEKQKCLFIEGNRIICRKYTKKNERNNKKAAISFIFLGFLCEYEECTPALGFAATNGTQEPTFLCSLASQRELQRPAVDRSYFTKTFFVVPLLILNY